MAVAGCMRPPASWTARSRRTTSHTSRRSRILSTSSRRAPCTKSGRRARHGTPSLPWRAELQPELFIEIGKALAEEKGIRNTDWVIISTPRARVRAKALVTDRIGVMQVAGKRIHHVGMPWHWGWAGLSIGDVVNDLTAWVGHPNVSSHEGKAFVCNVEKA